MTFQSRGEWNAYVAAGRTKEDRKKRFSEVPDKFKKDVWSHLETVAKLKRKQNG